MTLCVISPLLLSSCWWNKPAEPVVPVLENPVSLDSTLARYGSGEAAKIQSSIDSSDFSGNTVLIQKLITDAQTNSGQTSTGDIISLLFVQLENTLNQWNYEYNETESRDRGNEIIQKIIGIDPTYTNHPEILWFRWYSEEINRNYTGALALYQEAIQRSEGFTGTDIFQWRILNQISHVYSLIGNQEYAFAYTYKSYKKDPQNLMTSFNLGRYLALSGTVADSIPYFEYALNTPSLPMQSEIYFTLSSLMLDPRIGTIDIEKSIDYAKKSIEANPSYPMGYFWLAQAYYRMNDKKNTDIINENLEKSIKLNPNGFNAYELRGLVKFDNGDLSGAIADIKTAISVLPKDAILMADQRTYNSDRLYMLAFLLNYIRSGNPIDEKFKSLFLSRQYSADNLILQLNRTNNGFLGDSGEIVRSMFQ